MNAEVDALVAQWRDEWELVRLKDVPAWTTHRAHLDKFVEQLDELREALAARPAAPPVGEAELLREALAKFREADLDAQLMANALYNIPHRVQVDGSVRWEGRDSDQLRDIRLRWESSSRAARDAAALASPAPQPRKLTADEVEYLMAMGLSQDGTLALGEGAAERVMSLARRLLGASPAPQPAAPAPVEPPPAETVEIVRQVMADEARRLSGGGILSRAEITEPAPRPSTATGRAKLIEDEWRDKRGKE